MRRIIIRLILCFFSCALLNLSPIGVQAQDTTNENAPHAALDCEYLFNADSLYDLMDSLEQSSPNADKLLRQWMAEMKSTEKRKAMFEYDFIETIENDFSSIMHITYWLSMSGNSSLNKSELREFKNIVEDYLALIIERADGLDDHEKLDKLKSRILWISRNLADFLIHHISDPTILRNIISIDGLGYPLKFSTETIRLDQVELSLRTARTEEEQYVGLSFTLEKDIDGMLFLMFENEPQKFWNKNTLASLDVAFFDADGKLTELCSLKPQASPTEEIANCKSKEASQFVIEMPQGWFKANGLGPGTQLSFMP